MRHGVRQLVTRIGGMILVFGIGVAVLVWPRITEVRRIDDRIAELKTKIHGLSDQTDEIELLADRIATLDERVAGLRDIPRQPQNAELIRRLSVPVDGLVVQEQTFSAARATKAVPGSELPYKSIPVTIEMVSTFDSIFAIVQAAESMSRLVRVASVRIDHDVRSGPQDEVSDFLSATLVLEAIYEPATAAEGR
ncbi:MAG: type 4a pilus biogenesis protein PilO [Planctomycetota bacterium]